MKQVSKAVITQQNEYLLQLRDDRPDIWYGNHWSFFGGGLEIGETPWQALQRELVEELEWCPETGRFLYEWNNPEYPVRIHFFAVPFNGDRKQLVLHEGQSLRWFSIEMMVRESQIAPHVLSHVHRFVEASIADELNAEVEAGNL